ncbi:E3 ubiquitin-protein ligase RSL1-like [Typha angustifolia]|uniref:E3 ubiquitin-protein ligase RSL1-like n=1 Tax=Typha angustifolia TaxID=59011 RepID=UPI003C2F628D
MENLDSFGDGLFDNSDAEEEFQSCSAEDEWQEIEDSLASNNDLDEFSLRMFFKGVSPSESKGLGSKVSGIGVVMERSPGVPILQVQKKLDLCVEELVADHLALLDGLLVALDNGIKKIYAFTDSEKLYFQIAETEILEDKLLVALAHRILELADKLEDFDLTLVPSFELERPLHLAREAMGVADLPSDANDSVDYCPICCEEKPSLQMIELNCSHKFCSDCLVMYMEGRLGASKVPIRCPQVSCKYYVSTIESKSFLPDTSYESFERASMEAGVVDRERIDCPFQDCSVQLRAHQNVSSGSSSSSQNDANCVECTECRREFCISCNVPWHTSMACDERGVREMSSHNLAQNNRWRHCEECGRMIELTEGCYYMACWCGHEFCYSCGAEYRNGVQSCQCAFRREDNLESYEALSTRESEVWNWDTFDPISNATQGYTEQEREQLGLVHRFLAGGFGMNDQPACQSPPRCSDSYLDTMRDLHQLPWLERFVSVISDSYNDDFMQ